MQGEAGDRARGRAVGMSDMRKGRGGEEWEAKCADDLEEAYSRQTTITRGSGCREITGETNDTH